MYTDITLRFPEFIKPAFSGKTKYTIIRAGRQTGKTYNACQWICLQLMQNPGTRGLWVDTVHANITKYIDRYFKFILGDLWKSVHLDKQKNIITFANGSILDFGSAERPENLEGFGYQFAVINEAGIILKKKGLWEQTLEPMLQNAVVLIIGTPKGKTDDKRDNQKTVYFELSELAKIDPEWCEYHYTCYDSPYWEASKLDTLKKRLPAYIWSQEYMAEFEDVYENSLLEFEDLRFYNSNKSDEIDKIYIHADTTHTGKSTSDYFCLIVIGESRKDKNFYVLDFILSKLDVEQQARQTIVMYQKFSQKVQRFTYDEKANQGFGFWIKKLAKEEYGISLPIKELRYPHDKVSHFLPHIPHFKSGRVFLPTWHTGLSVAQAQLLAFPNTKVNDDFVDGLSGVLDNYKNSLGDPTFYTDAGMLGF